MEREGGSEREGARGRERGRERESERARVKTRDRQRKDEAKQVCRRRISARGGGWRIGERWDFRLEQGSGQVLSPPEITESALPKNPQYIAVTSHSNKLRQRKGAV